MGRIGPGEHGLPGCEHHVGLTVMDRGRGQQAQTPVVMLVVLPVEELAAEVQAVLDAGEAVGKLPLRALTGQQVFIPVLLSGQPVLTL